jgi:LPS-assembly protein
VAPPPATAAQPATDAAAPQGAAETPQYPDAVLLPPADRGTPISIDAKNKQSQENNVDILDGDAVITFRDRSFAADHIEYDADTGDVTLTGHLVVTEAENDLRIEASHGSVNIKTQTGKFYDVSGSVGMRRKAAAGVTLDGNLNTGSLNTGNLNTGNKAAAQVETGNKVYANGNPFLFTGRMVVKSGPRDYQIYGGTVTSCQLPSPDWLLSAAEFSMDGTTARARGSVFHLMSFPVLWLPYVTHPVDADNRQSGFLIPEIGFNSASKGTTIGEQVYWVINRSADLTAGAIYYSARGWEQTASFHYAGRGQDFVKARYSGLEDRGYTPSGGTYINQSGTDVLFSARYDLLAGSDSDAASAPAPVRLVGDVEYLSSFPYREAFSSNFNQAVSSDVVSTVYAVGERDGMAASLEGDRYQGEKRVASQRVTTSQGGVGVPLFPGYAPEAVAVEHERSTSSTVITSLPEEQVHIFHAPALEFASTDHALGSTGLEWNLQSSVAALKRAEPTFTTAGMVARVDLRPEIAYPMGFLGWRLRPAVAARETFYSRSRYPAVPGAPAVAGAPVVPGTPAVVENQASLNRSDIEFELDLRPPMLERTFDSGFLRTLLRHDVRHIIEPELTYRLVSGIGNFPDVLRFDAVDVASDTNEIEYGVTQRLYLRQKAGNPCRAAGEGADATELLGSAGSDADALEDPGEATGRSDAAAPVCGQREWISWRVAQKYFFDHSFGGAVVDNGPRSVLATTLDFSGIAFLTGPRNISPITSRLRVRTSEKTDVGWDFDYDLCSAFSTTTLSAAPKPCGNRFTADNIYVDVHQGDVHAGVEYAGLNAPARSYQNGSLSSVADFQQMRVLFGFGRPTRSGFSAQAAAGIDINLGSVQYGQILASYNWNCCGVSVEYRKYELGTARNDNGYKFNFTLANIGSAGNIRHADQIF